MITLILSRVPQGLRGHLTKWLLEAAPGVFVGKSSARVRDELWSLVCSGLEGGTALMIVSARNEQGFEIRNSGHAWDPVDLEGVTLMRRPVANDLTRPTVATSTPRAARFRWLQRNKK